MNIIYIENVLYMYIYTEYHFAIHLKLTQHFKPTILQLKNKKPNSWQGVVS